MGEENCQCLSRARDNKVYLRWLPTVLRVHRPEEGWRTKNELFVSALGLSKLLAFTVKISNTPSFHSYCRLLPWQQTIVKNSQFFPIFHIFASISIVSLSKISWNSAVLWKRFWTILILDNNLKKWNLSRGFLKILQFPIFDNKKRNP